MSFTVYGFNLNELHATIDYVIKGQQEKSESKYREISIKIDVDLKIFLNSHWIAPIKISSSNLKLGLLSHKVQEPQFIERAIAGVQKACMEILQSHERCDFTAEPVTSIEFGRDNVGFPVLIYSPQRMGIVRETLDYRIPDSRSLSPGILAPIDDVWDSMLSSDDSIPDSQDLDLGVSKGSGASTTTKSDADDIGGPPSF